MRGYLSQNQIQLLESLTGEKLRDVFEHYWESSDLSSLDYIELDFFGQRMLLTSGSLAEDLEVTLKSETSMHTRSGVRLRVTRATEKLGWKSVIGRALTSYELTDYKGYCNNSVIFNFESVKVEVYAGLDCVGAEFEEEKIGQKF